MGKLRFKVYQAEKVFQRAGLVLGGQPPLAWRHAQPELIFQATMKNTM